MPRVKKSETKVKEKKVKKTVVKALAVKAKSVKVKAPKAVKTAAVKVKKTATVKATPKKVDVKELVEKTPKKQSRAEVGNIKLKGKEADILKKYQHSKTDTGSTEVQIALFSAKIAQLTKHLKKHGKDSDSKRGLLIMVGKRRRLLNYLAKSDEKRYQNLIIDLGLRK